jgi:hypothetical protein
MPKWVKLIVAVGLLPLCLGAASALQMVLQHSGDADTTWVPLLAGAGCWLVVYVFLPKPMWLYVFGHELTHALWTLLFGGEVRDFKATARGGHVIITRNNFLIALAPYFFPLYALLVVAAFFVGRLIWNWDHYLVWFHLTLGAAYAFHVTLTFHTLKTHQTDITDQGYLFSGVVIFLGNAAVLLLGIALTVRKVGIWTALGWWGERTGQVFHVAGRWLNHWKH